MKFFKNFVVCLGIFFILIGCGNNSFSRYDLTFFNVFDTVIDIIVYDKSEQSANKNLALMRDEFERLHKLFDRYNDYDGVVNLKSINDRAYISPMKIPDELFNLIKRTLELNRSTSSHVNITMAPVIDLWQKYSDLYNANYSDEDVRAMLGNDLPSEEDLNALRAYIDEDNIVLNDSDKTIFIKNEFTKLDLGSVAKGYATELVADYARDELGIKSFLISAGGNVKVVGKPYDKKFFKVAIQNPDDKDDSNTFLRVLEVNDTSIVTSGDYQRFFTYDGVRYTHIYDSATLKPVRSFKSVTVIAKDSMLCDYLSTTLFMSSIDEGKKLCKDFSAEAIWATKDGEVVMTDGASKLVSQ